MIGNVRISRNNEKISGRRNGNPAAAWMHGKHIFPGSFKNRRLHNGTFQEWNPNPDRFVSVLQRRND